MPAQEGGTKVPPSALLKQRQLLRDLARDGGRKHGEVAQASIDEHASTIKVIKKRNKILLEELANEGRQSSMDPFYNKAKKNELAHIEKELCTFTKKVEQERKHVQTLLEETHVCEKKLTQLQQSMDGTVAAKNNKALVGSRVKALEAELDRKFVKFNEVIANNNKTRQNIDHLRLERASFDLIYTKLEREFKVKMGTIAVVQNQIVELEAERNALKAHLHGLKASADSKQKVFEEKSAKILMDVELGKTEEFGLRSAGGAKVMRGMLTDHQEEKLRTGLNVSRWKIAENQILKSRTQDELESVHDELQNLFDFANCDNVQEFRRLYDEQERQHTQSVSTLEELASNCRKVSEENTHIRQRISRLKAEYNEGHKKIQERREDFQMSLSMLTETSQRLQDDHNKSIEIFEDLKPGMQKLYTRWLASLKDNKEVTEKHGITFHFGNALSVLTVMEERIQEITMRYCERMEPETGQKLLETGPKKGSIFSSNMAVAGSLGSTFDPNNRVVDLRAATKSILSNVVSRELPSMHDGNTTFGHTLDSSQPSHIAGLGEGHDDDEHPLSYEELKSKIYKQSGSTQLVS
jgi:hypothetical protein